ncbi:MAG: DUF4330 domain-containing protein [Defluviitaleaceae bacterium]|nr:DUF4330 domain-containing protein [Defluviitaleaceae bacterium]
MLKDSKLFGKINIIDFFIIVALIGAAIFGVYQLRSGRGPLVLSQAETKDYIISFFTEEVESFSAEALSTGVNAFDHGRNIPLGVVDSFEINDAIIWNADQNGNTVRSNKPGHSSVEITARLTATPSEHGIVVAGNRYGIGHSLVLRAGRSIIFMRISGLEEVN